MAEGNRFDNPWGLTCGPTFGLTSGDDGPGVGQGTTTGEGTGNGVSTTDSSASDSDLIESYVEEHLQIGGAVVNVFKLKGVHEQGKLMDVTGFGRPISSGNVSDNFPLSEVFEANPCNGWKSSQTGDEITNSGWIGYDFGPIRKCDREVYGITTAIMYHIQTIRLQQGAESRNRATKIRVERSNDGATWLGTDIIVVPDNDALNEYAIKSSSKARYWRLRPLEFNGGENDHWQVLALELHEFGQTSLRNLQDEMGFMEQRDRDYASDSIPIKAHYDLLDARTDLQKFGIDMSSGQQFYFNVSFSGTVRALGRPIVIGDIFEVPSEAQYTPDLKPIRKYLEVTDVGWSVDGYTPNWRPTMQRIVAEPLMASQETWDVLGEYDDVPDVTGFLDVADDQVQELNEITEQITRSAEQNVPERGADSFEVAEIPEEVIEQYADQGIDVAKLNIDPKRLYIQDGLPPNGLHYTEGDTYPLNPTDGDYHRLTYTALNDNIPPRLFRWSITKNRWIYCETDMRGKYNRMKPRLQALITSDTSVASDEITE